VEPGLLAAPALPYALIHRSAWNRNSPKFVIRKQRPSNRKDSPFE
jgi:hypothetical protein